MESDHRKPRRIQALDGSGAGKPTGLMVSKAIPSVPSLLTEDIAWQEMHDDCVAGVVHLVPVASPRSRESATV
jgi:hypothetical protein